MPINDGKLNNDTHFRSLRGVSKYAAIGDSITADESFGGRKVLRARGLTFGGNFGVAGERMDQILARAATGPGASGSAYCFTNGGTNDIEQSRAESLLRADVEALWEALLDRGIQPLDWNIPPRGTEVSGRANRRIVHNLWRNIRARRLNIPHADAWSPMADAAGLMLSSLHSDGIHPNGTGHAILAQALAVSIDSQPRVAPLMAPTDAIIVDGSNTLTCFPNMVSMADADANGLATGIFPTGTGGVYSLETVAATDGRTRWQKCAISAGTDVGINLLSSPLSSIGWTVGDRIALSVGIRAKADAGAALVLNEAWGSFGRSNITEILFAVGIGNAAEEMLNYYTEFNIAGGTSAVWHLRGTGTGYFAVNRPVMLNLTKLGVA